MAPKSAERLAAQHQTGVCCITGEIAFLKYTLHPMEEQLFAAKPGMARVMLTINAMLMEFFTEASQSTRKSSSRCIVSGSRKSWNKFEIPASYLQERVNSWIGSWPTETGQMLDATFRAKAPPHSMPIVAESILSATRTLIHFAWEDSEQTAPHESPRRDFAPYESEIYCGTLNLSRKNNRKNLRLDVAAKEHSSFLNRAPPT